MNNELSPMAWAMYNFLEEATLGNESFVEQKYIYQHLKLKGFSITWNESQNQHNDHCRKLKDLVDEINFSTRLDKMVYVSDYYYRIANEEQAEEIRAYYHQKAMLALERESLIAKKCKRDGQGKLVNNAGSEMKPGNKPFHEAYNKAEEPKTRTVYATVEETTEHGLKYTQLYPMPVPNGLSDEETEKYIKSKLRANLTLLEWR